MAAKYCPVQTMDQNQEPVPKAKFYVHSVPAKIHEAHRSFIRKLKDVGQMEVDSLQECDYVLIFCLIVSRVGTDISEVLENAPAGKPITLVVMHHTFKQNQVVAQSRRVVTKPNVELTVDFLFYEDRFLKCKRNENAWLEIKKYLRVTQDQTFCINVVPSFKECLKPPRVYVVAVILVLLLAVLILLVLFCMKVI